MELSLAVDDWLEWMAMSKNRSNATVIKYRGYLLAFSHYLDGDDWVDVELSDLEGFSGRYLFERGLRAKSRSAAIAAVRGFYSWAFKKGLVASDPSEGLDHPTIGRRLPRAISLQDAEKLMAVPDLDTFCGIRDAAILALLFGCGMRVSGLCSMNQSSLLFSKDNESRERLYVRVIEKGAKERIIPAPMETLLLVRAYIGHKDLDEIDRSLPGGDQVLFVSVRNRKVPAHDYIGEKRRFSTRSVNDMIAKYCTVAGISAEFAHPHAMRHLYGAELMESDVNLLSSQALLGHENAETTEIYAHIATRKLTAEVDRANPLGKINTPVTSLISRLNL